jgi:integrase
MMAIQSAGRGYNTHLIKITLGYEPGTRKRLYYTETIKGTKKEARLREAELKIQLRDKKLMLSSGMTFRVFFDHYLDEARSRLSLNCFHNYESSIKRYLLPSIGDKKLKELVKNDFQQVYDSMSTRGLSAHTVQTLSKATRAVITWAMKKRLLNEDILKGVTLPNIPKAKPEFLTYEEMQAFFDVAQNYWYGNAFKFQFVTGLRNQELMALRWEDINFETATIRIRRACCWVDGKFHGLKSTKTGEERTIELDPPTIDFLKRLKAKQEAHIKSRKSRGLLYGDNRLIFCTRDGRVPNMSTVRKCFNKILKGIGITRRFRWYGIRHTHATHLLDVKGANPKMISNRLGHSVQMLFRTYGHEMPGQQREALSKISSRVKL